MKNLLFLYLLLIASFCYGLDANHSYIPPEGIVPTEDVAKKIAEAVLVPIYGKKKIDGEKPFNVELRDNVWFVTGSIPKPNVKNEMFLGGVFIILISKQTGEILSVGHEK